jgi:DNA-binding transcriptional LysR family regulator
MDAVDGMRVFVRVAQRSGFAVAARELRLSPAAVTKHVAALEARLGARLLERTTRRVALTEAGRVYLERCQECLQAFDDADAAMSQLSVAPQGMLRISAPVDLQAALSPVIARYMQANPHVVVDLRLSNRSIDLVDEGFDLAIRVAPALDGRYVARLLAEAPLGVFASPAYLREHGRPKRPADLARHRYLAFVEPRPMETLVFERKGRQVKVDVKPVALANIGSHLIEMALAGLGVMGGPGFLMRRAVESGTLEHVLADWDVLPRMRLWALYPHRRFLPAKVRLFVELLRETAAAGDGWP